MLTLKAFGPLDVRDASGRSLAALLSQSKRSALLTYLVLAHPHELYRRDHLLALFWPGLDQQHGRNALSQSLSFLRRALGGDVLVTRGAEEIGVDPTAIGSDVRTFEAAVSQGDWARALEAYGGDLLEGLQVVGAAPFTDWVDRKRARLREAASGAAWKLARARIEAGELTAAERAAQRALALVPTDESPVRTFIEALAAAGDRAAALRFYERFAGVLAQELEVDPAPETVAVMEAVRGRTEAAEVAHLSAPAPIAMAERTEKLVSSAVVPLVERPATRRGPRLGRHPTIVWVVLAGVVLAAWGVDARTGGTAGPGTLIGEGVAAKYDGMVVADLSAPFDPGLGATASELLRAALDQSDIVRPVAGPAIGAALRRMQRDPTLPFDPEAAREVATRDGYPLVVAGEIEDVGQRYLLTVRLESPAGEVLGRFNRAATEADLVQALDHMGGEIRERIGDSRRAIRRSPSLEQVTTPSLEALRLYSQAVRLSDWEGRPYDAVPLLERAIGIDSAFAAGYRKLYITLTNHDLQLSRRGELIERAYRFKDRLTEFERLQVEENRAWASPQADANECQLDQPVVQRYEAYIRQHPEDPRPLHQYGFHLAHVGRRDEAIEVWRRRIAMDDAPAVTFQALLLAELKTGEGKAALGTLEQWRERLGESPPYYQAVSQIASAAGDYAAADSIFEAGRDRSHLGGDELRYLAALSALRGRIREADRRVRDAQRQYRLRGLDGGAVDADVWMSLVRLVALGDSATAVQDAAASVDAFPDDQLGFLTRTNLGLLYALAGELPRAREVSDTLTRYGVQNWALVVSAVRAPLAIAAGDPGEALTLLRDADIECFSYGADPRWFALFRGRAHERAGRPDSAIAAYEAFLAAYPNLDWDSVFLFDTLGRLGRLYEGQGDGAKAAATYARAADLWRDADPELQPRVQRLRERAAELTARKATSPGGAP